MSLADNYNKAKSQVGEAVLLFEMGDFYEALYGDAELTANKLGLTLVSRNRDNPVPMTGFPRHQLDKHADKLQALGYSVAVASMTGGKVEPKIIREKA